MLQLHNINKTYRDGTRALKDISLQLGTGMLGLLGPNGAGKSSLMRTIATIQAPDSGRILFEGRDMAQEPYRLRSRLGYLPQHFGVYPHISCYALLEHLAILKGLQDKPQRRRQIDQVLALTNLTGQATRQPSHFSGGQLQRFGVAQALLGNPQILILDEPTAGLDPVERLRLHQLLHDIAQTRLVLLSTHIVEDIEHLAGHTALLIDGAIVACGHTRALFSYLDGKIWQGPAKHPLPGNTQLLGQRLHYGKPMVRLFSQQCPAAEFEPVPPSLQDSYFLALQKHTGVIA
ncbi:ATP-binding cassette domain-containing protein [Microbulbifer spongiae]|uniref:ATP-binding cassette domain-containing protein n=1 Tax=Microbulbifer spongiae TaxID=2944933 RepID=A0ABY9EBR0_9GAMM|nr:ATP-binding cassette domain-containing protein [Microbulbifer sp. MI-G]WKD50458.1 ATP-binding cassette domain-containing protein [Microbulbifer sp. MI-G]